MEKKQTPVQKAILAAGGQNELARRLGCTPQHISKLKKKGKVPTNQPVKWLKATGLSKRDLFPQFYEDIFYGEK